MIKTLIISGCTSSKLKEHPLGLAPADFLSAASRTAREKALYAIDPSLEQKAYDMYTGGFYGKGDDEAFREGFDSFKSKIPNYSDYVDLRILSAGYGLLKEDAPVFPYNVSYNNFGEIKKLGFKTMLDWGNHLNSRPALDAIISNYDLVLVFLSDGYLKALNIPDSEFDLKPDAKVIFFNKKRFNKKTPIAKTPSTYHTFLTDANTLKMYNTKYGGGANCVNLRGKLAFRIFKDLVDPTSADPFKTVFENYANLEKMIL